MAVYVQLLWKKRNYGLLGFAAEGKTVFPRWCGVGLGGDLQVLAGNKDLCNANHSVLDGWSDASVLSF